MPRISALPAMTTVSSDDELPIVDVSESTTKKVNVGDLTPVGMVVDFAGSSAPSGWLFCYGQTLNAQVDTEYQTLYDVIGNTYGGTSNSDFVVPDLRGRVIAGQDDMGGSSANRLTGNSGGVNGDTLGGSGGSESANLQHSHTVNSHNHNEGNFNTGDNDVNHTHSGIVRGVASSDGINQNHRHLYTRAAGNASPGTNNALSTTQNIVQPTFILNKIIRY